MAVHPCLNGLTIRTKVNGRFSHEYDDDEQTLDEGSLSKYIEAKSGAHFAIGLDFSDEYLYKTIPMVAQVLIDGESMGHYLFGPFDLHRPLKYYEEIDGINVDKPEGSMRHRFAFSEIVIGMRQFLLSPLLQLTPLQMRMQMPAPLNSARSQT